MIKFNTTKILVTGASGFIGQVLCRQLQDKGFDVTAAVRNQGTSDTINSIALDFNATWLNNPCLGFGTVFHLAGKAHALSELSQDEAEYLRINTYGTKRLLEAAQQAEVKRFIFFSSVKAVGDSETLQDETSVLPADTPYGQSKHAAEQLVLYGKYVPQPVVIRPAMVYGNTTKGNLAKMIRAIERGFFPPLPETNNKRSMVHVADVVQAAILAAQTPQAAGQIYIVTDGQAYSSRQIYAWICQALHKKIPPFTIPLSALKLMAKTGDMIGSLQGKRFLFDSDALTKLIGSAYYSSAKIEHELGFKPNYHLADVLPEIVARLKQQ